MKYVGSKNRHAKEILPIILKERESLEQWYVEPFCGGCNTIDKVKGNRLANDINYYLIECLKSLSVGWVPPEIITEEQYYQIKNNMINYSPDLVGYVGFQLSYGAVWFSTYRRDKNGKRNYSKEAFNNVMKQAPFLKGIVFENKSYLDLEIPENSIIYCDPPYQDTVKYKVSPNFNYTQFWSWVREKSKNHQVFVSEYNAPDDFKCIWQKKVNNTLAKDTGSKHGVEKLFVLK